MPRPSFTLRGFERPHATLQRALGDLERAVLEATWSLGAVSVRNVCEALNSRSYEKPVAYTTAMTTLDRLYKKRLLSRRKSGRAFIYSPRVSREDFDRVVTTDMIDALLGAGEAGPAPVLACIVDAVSARDRSLLDELDRLVTARRRARPSTSEDGDDHAKAESKSQSSSGDSKRTTTRTTTRSTIPDVGSPNGTGSTSKVWKGDRGSRR